MACAYLFIINEISDTFDPKKKKEKKKAPLWIDNLAETHG